MIRESRKNRDSSDSETEPVKGQIAIIIGTTKKSGQQATFILAIDWGGVEHSAEHQSRTSGRYGKERTNTDKHSAGPIKGEKTEQCTGN